MLLHPFVQESIQIAHPALTYSKVQALAVCFEGGPYNMTRLFESMEAWHMVSYNATVFIVLAALMLSTIRGKQWCKQA